MIPSNFEEAFERVKLLADQFAAGMSKKLHRRRALESTTQGISLNTLINTKLTRS